MTGITELDAYVGTHVTIARYEHKIFEVIDANLNEKKLLLTLKEVGTNYVEGNKAYCKKSEGILTEEEAMHCYSHGPVIFGYLGR